MRSDDDLFGLRGAVTQVLREHRRTTGMAVAMGETCKCGVWCEGASISDPTKFDLAMHQADEVRKALGKER